MNRDFNHLRKNYVQKSLLEEDLPKDPMKLFDHWFQEALQSDHSLEPNAMSLATIDEDLSPRIRVVLLKSFSDEGFVFYTNYKSKKGCALEKYPKVCLSFFWPDKERQIIIKGETEKLSAQASDLYFSKRPKESAVGAWASQQSSTVPSREYLEKRYEHYTSYFNSHNLYRPPFWGGYLVRPYQMEFWQGRSNRMHDRISFLLTKAKKWETERLAP